MHYYQFHIGDYKAHTHHLSLMEDLAYRRLLDFYYLHEGPIKAHDIARQIGMREYEQDVLTVLNEFFMSTPDGFINARADKEIENYRSMSEGGKRGAAKRWSKGRDSPPIEPLIATNNHKPITNNHKPNKATGVACPEGLDSSLWIDFLTMRKAKKLPMTQTALDGLTKQAEKIGWTLAQVIEECVNRGWGGFKAEWLTQKNNVADIARITVPGKQERDPALVKLDQDRQITKPPSLEVLARMAELRGRS